MVRVLLAPNACRKALIHVLGPQHGELDNRLRHLQATVHLATGSPSDVVKGKTRVPQTTVLSPFLFTMHTANFSFNSRMCHLQKIFEYSTIQGCISEADGRNGGELYQMLQEEPPPAKYQQDQWTWSRKPQPLLHPGVGGLIQVPGSTVHKNNKMD